MKCKKESCGQWHYISMMIFKTCNSILVYYLSYHVHLKYFYKKYLAIGFQGRSVTLSRLAEPAARGMLFLVCL